MAGKPTSESYLVTVISCKWRVRLPLFAILRNGWGRSTIIAGGLIGFAVYCGILLFDPSHGCAETSGKQARDVQFEVLAIQRVKGARSASVPLPTLP